MSIIIMGSEKLKERPLFCNYPILLSETRNYLIKHWEYWFGF